MTGVWLTGGQLLGVAVVLLVVLISFYLWMKDVPMFIGETDLRGKTCIITGANAGIGYVTALEFARRHARVILACRNTERGEAARSTIVRDTGNDQVVVKRLDLSSLSSVRRFAQEVNTQEERVDMLVNNAGVIGVPTMTTEDGLEVNFATNHFGPFLLTNLLLDKLKQCAPSRILNVSSTVQRMGKVDFDNLKAEKYYSTHEVYFNSKLANVLFTREMARRLNGTGVTVCSLHPGSVHTSLLNNMPFYVRLPMRAFTMFLRTPEEGAQTTLYCALAPEVGDMSGKYFAECQLAEVQVNPLANDPDTCLRLWDVSCQYTNFRPVDETAL